ncbi:hypothetical protein CYY_003900 [Polysphondylium violaceum]|uniref:F-box domain-containing protein n=1 Tax=Polysphondylium violaceum TaxID=133409 RepID=A0A8J4PW39_9MYCE|nr:hypothetical protein CYY_003900 [Polysphondylium violaceum]
MISNVLQKLIIHYYFNELKEEIESIPSFYGVREEIIKDVYQDKKRLSLVSKYWFQQISSFINFEMIYQYNRDEAQYSPSIYIHLNDTINNPFNLLKFSSNLSLDLNLHIQSLVSKHKQEKIDDSNDGNSSNNNNNNKNSKEIMFYKDYYSNVRRLSLDLGSLWKSNEIVQDLFRAVIEVSQNSPKLEYFQVLVPMWAIDSYAREKEFNQALLELGITDLHINFYNPSYHPFDQQQIESLKYFIKFHSRTIRSLTVQENIEDFQLFSDILVLLKDSLREINYSSIVNFGNASMIEDDSVFVTTLQSLSLDNFYIKLLTEDQYSMLCVKNNIGTSECSPISIIDTTRSKRFKVNIKDIISTIKYSPCIKSLEIKETNYNGSIYTRCNSNALSREITEMILKNMFQHLLDFLYIRVPLDIDCLTEYVLANAKAKHVLLDYKFKGTPSFYQALSTNTTIETIQINNQQLDMTDKQLLVESVLANNTLRYIRLYSKLNDDMLSKLIYKYDILDQNSVLLKRKSLEQQQQFLLQKEKEKEKERETDLIYYNSSKLLNHISDKSSFVLISSVFASLVAIAVFYYKS